MLWELIQRHIDNVGYPVSERTIAARLGVTPNTLKHWRDLKRLPSRENLEAIANLVGVRYAVVLDAALHDTGYHESAEVIQLQSPATQPELTVEQVEEQRQQLLSALAELDGTADREVR